MADAAAQNAATTQNVVPPVALQTKAAAKPKSRVCSSFYLFLPCIYSLEIYKARKEADILPANLAMNEKIRQLREHWECSMSTCHSEVCFVPAEGPHFALSHDLTEKWAAAIVSLSMIYMGTLTHIGYHSFVALSLRPSQPLPTLLHLTQFQLTPSFQNLRFSRPGSITWQKKKARKPRSSTLCFLITLERISLRTFNPHGLHLRLPPEHQPFLPALYHQTIVKDPRWTSPLSASSIL